MTKQVTLDSLELKGLNIFRPGGKLRVEAHYSLLAGNETYKSETREVTGIPSDVTRSLEKAWDAIMAQIKAAESI